MPDGLNSKIKCLPTYILIDTSSSMRPDEATLNETVEYLYDELIMSPRISDFAYISLLAFGSQAHVILEMSDISQVLEIPYLECGGVTNLAAAFVLLRQTIDRDIPRLREIGRQVLRPIAFVLTDGQPTDELGRISGAWRVEFDRLVDPLWQRRPNVVPFGIGGAVRSVLSEMATLRGAAFLAQDSTNSDALRRIFATLLNTLVASAQSNELRLPREIDGFVTVNQDIIE